MADEVTDLIDLLSMEQQGHIRSTAMEYTLGMTADKRNGPAFFKANPGLLTAIGKCTGDERYPVVAKEAWLALVNLSSINDSFGKQMVAEGLVEAGVKAVMDPKSTYADEVSMVLANVSRFEAGSNKILTLEGEDGRAVLFTLCDIFCKGPAFNPEAKFHYLAHVLFNVTQKAEGRQQIMQREGQGCLFQRLLMFTDFKDSIIRRGGVIGCIRNCCFSSSDHEWLLGPEVNVLTYLLMPLVGPEEMDEDDMEGMPDELQYQPPDKVREEDVDLRKMLVEALAQLNSTRAGRECLRSLKAYPVLRNYHLWESDELTQQACEEVVRIIITPEMEDTLEGDGNLQTVELSDVHPNAEPQELQIGAPEGYYLKHLDQTKGM
jgi:hypothetical protein